MSLDAVELESRQIYKLLMEQGSLVKVWANVIDSKGAYVIDGWEIRRRVYMANSAVTSFQFHCKVVCDCHGNPIHWVEIDECAECAEKHADCTCAQQREYDEACRKALDEIEPAEAGEIVKLPETLGIWDTGDENG